MKGHQRVLPWWKSKINQVKWDPKSGAPFCFREQHLLCWKPKITSNSPTQTIKQIFDSPGKPCRFTSQTTPIHAKTETFSKGGEEKKRLRIEMNYLRSHSLGCFPCEAGMCWHWNFIKDSLLRTVFYSQHPLVRRQQTSQPRPRPRFAHTTIL